eukprot:4108329-Pleurochrysis_carterae.AAC.2
MCTSPRACARTQPRARAYRSLDQFYARACLWELVDDGDERRRRRHAVGGGADPRGRRRAWTRAARTDRDVAPSTGSASTKGSTSSATSGSGRVRGVLRGFCPRVASPRRVSSFVATRKLRVARAPLRLECQLGAVLGAPVSSRCAVDENDETAGGKGDDAGDRGAGDDCMLVDARDEHDELTSRFSARGCAIKTSLCARSCARSAGLRVLSGRARSSVLESASDSVLRCACACACVGAWRALGWVEACARESVFAAASDVANAAAALSPQRGALLSVSSSIGSAVPEQGEAARTPHDNMAFRQNREGGEKWGVQAED